MAMCGKMGSIRKHVVINGKVQGVFFRSSAQKRATSLGIGGWIKNMPDGKVEAVFEGKEEAVRKMLSWCWKGSGPAHVIDLKTKDEEPSGEEKDFRIKT